MSLTAAQQATLKADILADPTLAAIPNTADGDFQIAATYNAIAGPDFWVWRSAIASTDYRGVNGIVWTEVDALTVSKARIFEWLTGQLTLPINASDPNVRAGIQNAFGTSQTLTNLTNMGRRPATRAEKLFAAGAGTAASPATLAFEGAISYYDVMAARNS